MADMNINLDPDSWQNYCEAEEFKVDDGKVIKYYDMFVPSFDIMEARDGDITIVVGDIDRCDLLALTYYESEMAWWVIALRNNLELPSVSFLGGVTIVIPDPSFVKSEILKQVV